MKPYSVRAVAAAAGAVLLAGTVTACNRGRTTTSGSAGAAGRQAIGTDLPRADLDCRNSYAQYIKQDIGAHGLSALPISNSSDAARMRQNFPGHHRPPACHAKYAPLRRGRGRG